MWESSGIKGAGSGSEDDTVFGIRSSGFKSSLGLPGWEAAAAAARKARQPASLGHLPLPTGSSKYPQTLSGKISNIKHQPTEGLMLL